LGRIESLLTAFGVLAGTILFVLLTIPMTAEAPVDKEGQAVRRRAAVQTLVLLLIVFLTGYDVVASRRALPKAPVWTSLVTLLYDLERAVHVPLNCLVNPTLYFVLPCGLLLALGARWPEMGFRRGFHTWRVAALWSALPLLFAVVTLVRGQTTLNYLLVRAIHTTLSSGPFEEFLFRGALQTRLGHTFTKTWGIVLSGLAFGLWHTGANLQNFEGNLPAAAAMAIVNQGIGGVGLGIVFQRTRNLLATSVIHVSTNVAFG
jgi:membrane protease YdiL (CAAX protease family)